MRKGRQGMSLTVKAEETYAPTAMNPAWADGKFSHVAVDQVETDRQDDVDIPTYMMISCTY